MRNNAAHLQCGTHIPVGVRKNRRQVRCRHDAGLLWSWRAMDTRHARIAEKLVRGYSSLLKNKLGACAADSDLLYLRSTD